ncbi:hypothetical protein ACIRN4_16180 [Pimelobacter simplex]|uniref:hypothetical protein n=1 Tax=Nocardioides simplex TaxID=2045 RepID=UPI0038016DE5
MTDTDPNHDPRLSTALRERLRDERPDLEHLAQSSLRAGIRARRGRQRRQAGAAAGAVLGVAAVAVTASVLSGGGTTARDGTVATTPTPSATATVTATPTPGDQRSHDVGAPGDPSLPFTLDLAGWTCEYFPVDDKAWCTSTSGGNLSVVVRPAEDHAAWAGQPDKGADPSTLWTSPVHGNYFVTVQGGAGPDGLGATPLQAFIDGLHLAPRWDRP